MTCIPFKAVSRCVSLVLCGAALWAGFAQAEEADPYETLNRHTYEMNKGLDTAIIKPVATLYMTATPAFVRDGVTNVFENLSDVSNSGNALFQGKFYQAWSDLWRVLINTTVGVGGLIDVASRMDNLPKHREDFGLTMAHWGYQDSAFFVIPVFGPSTIRDTAGMFPDYYLFSIYHYWKDVQGRNILFVVQIVNARANLLILDKAISQASFDPYVFERNAYLQNRKQRMVDNANYEPEYLNDLPVQGPAPTQHQLTKSPTP